MACWITSRPSFSSLTSTSRQEPFHVADDFVLHHEHVQRTGLIHAADAQVAEDIGARPWRRRPG